MLRRRLIGLATGAVITSPLVPVILRVDALSAREKTALSLTPAQTEGPFYPVNDQADKDVDLTRIVGHADRARGRVIQVTGRVMDERANMLSGAQVEIWQANAAGRYQHIRDRNPAPVDPDFQGWGITRTSAAGNYQFTTIFPGAYPAGVDWLRPPHIHFKVAKPGYRDLTTQMYFPDQSLNASDLILNSLPSGQQRLLIANHGGTAQADKNMTIFLFDIVLRTG